MAYGAPVDYSSMIKEYEERKKEEEKKKEKKQEKTEETS